MPGDGLPRRRYRPRRAVEIISEVALLAAFAGGLWCVLEPRGLLLETGGTALLVVVAIQAILLFHDCMHQSAFGQRRLEAWVGRAIGAFYGCPFHFLRAEHLRHHRHAGLVDDDPEALHLAEPDAARRPSGRLLMRLGRRASGALLYTWLLQLGQFARWLGRQARRRDDAALVRATAIDIACMLALWLPLAAWLHARGAYLRVVVHAFAIPAVAGLAVVYLAAKPLHTLMVPSRLAGRPYAERQFCVTRSFTTHPALALLICNLCYHLEHHLYPHVSRWDLPALAREVRPALVAFARRRHLPLAIHDGYTSWIAAAAPPAYNPIAGLDDWGERNRGFRYAEFNAP